MLERTEVEEALRLGHEQRWLEVKGPGSLTAKAYVAKVSRAALAMGNLQDGGYVILGIDDQQIQDMLPGLSPVQLAEWSNHDDVTVKINAYADPPLQLTLKPMKLTSGAAVVVLRIEEFLDVPHICAKQYEDILRPVRCTCAPGANRRAST